MDDVFLVNSPLMLVQMLIGAVVALVACGLIWVYQITKPPPPKICGSPGGPPVTLPRIKLRDGRYLAYKERGVVIENARYKIILSHGFCASKETYVPLSDKCLEEMGICLITFDRPGYSESDPNARRSPKSDAFDIQELADQLELGPKFYVIGLSMGSYPIWGCLKYIPHRLAGVVFVAPVVNYWWPSLPNSAKATNEASPISQSRLRLMHYAPLLGWILQRWFPLPTVDVVVKQTPQAFRKFDMEIMNKLSNIPAPDAHKIKQQGVYESLYRDVVVAFSSWEFDPLELSNPFIDTQGSAHIWIGGEDGIVSVELLHHIAERLPWIRRHEVPHGGHLFFHDENICQNIFKSLLLGEKTASD